MITIQEITKLTGLARIKLSEQEKKELQGDMEAILDYFKKLQELNFEDSKEKIETGENLNVNELRNDEAGAVLYELSKILLNQTPERENGYIKVKKIL